jgi:hypothetical protein
MNERILAIFDSVDQAQAAAADLQLGGVPRAAITIMSSEPLHLADSERQPKSRIGLFAIAGGVIGGLFGILLTVWTSRRVDIVTGGMAIVTPWAFGIIVFELTALGVILATLLKLIFEARLARRGSLDDCDVAIADGYMVVSVENPSDAHREIARQVLGSNISHPIAPSDAPIK